MNPLPRVGRFAGLGALLFVVLTCSPVAYWLGIPLHEISTPRKSDVIVLFSSNQIDSMWLTPDAAQRTMGAIQMYRSDYAAAIITSGSNMAANKDYAALHADWLAKAGVPRSAIMVENESGRTHGSVLNVAAIMRRHKWNSALAVTSELDAKRVRLVFEKQKVPVCVIGVPQSRPPRGIIYFPDGAFAFYNAVYEYAGLTWYKLRGWI